MKLLLLCVHEYFHPFGLPYSRYNSPATAFAKISLDFSFSVLCLLWQLGLKAFFSVEDLMLLSLLFLTGVETAWTMEELFAQEKEINAMKVFNWLYLNLVDIN